MVEWIGSTPSWFEPLPRGGPRLPGRSAERIPVDVADEGQQVGDARLEVGFIEPVAGVGGGVKAAGEARPGLVRDERRRGKAVRQERVRIAGELRIVHVVKATRETYSGAQVGAVSSRV